MNKVEARGILEDFLEDLKKRSREELLGCLGCPVSLQKTGKSGAVYQIEYEVVWDSEPGHNLRIIASIDDGGFLSVFTPITAGFLVSSEGQVLE